MNNECNLNTLTGAEILQLIDSGKFGSPIDRVDGFSWCSETYRNGYKRIIRVKSSSVIADEPGIYLYKIDPITNKQTLIEFLPEETNNINNKNE